MSLLLTSALLLGLILCVVLFPLILLVLRINPEIMLKDYPPDIQARHGPMTERTRRQRVPVAIVFVVMILLFVALAVWHLQRLSGGADITFLRAFVYFLVIFGTFNLLDWIVLDWLIVVRLRPRFVVLPGTDGMPGYTDWWFHFRGFLIGIPIVVVACALVAAIVSAVA